jgi:menaquinone-dependent protoporphyrinogen IX oxidase
MRQETGTEKQGEKDVRGTGAKGKPEPTEKKSENRTLIAYVTKGGATMEAAQAIATTLRDKFGLEVDVVNLRKQPTPNLAPYRNVILGGGVRMGKIYDEAPKFLEQDLSEKRVALFVCASAAGNPVHHDALLDKYIKKELANSPNIKPVAVEAFGGCIKILGKKVIDTMNLAKIQAWAEELGTKLAA